MLMYMLVQLHAEVTTVTVKSKVKVSWNSIFETQSLILENFKNWGLSWISQCLRPLKESLMAFEKLSRQSFGLFMSFLHESFWPSCQEDNAAGGLCSELEFDLRKKKVAYGELRVSCLMNMRCFHLKDQDGTWFAKCQLKTAHGLRNASPYLGHSKPFPVVIIKCDHF